MISLAAAEEPPDAVRGLIIFGFPLRAAGKPGAERVSHLRTIKIPMLLLQGSRDALADLKRLEPLCAGMGKRVKLLVVDGGDHSFHLLKSAERSDNEALEAIVEKAANGSNAYQRS